jgi:hypothetical protein
MNPFPFYTMPVNPFRSWAALAWKTGETMLASGQVIRHRSQRLLAAGHYPSANDRREFALMGQEKIAAAAESSQALALSGVRISQQLSAIAFEQMISAATGMMTLAASRTAGQAFARQSRLMRETLSGSAAATSKLSRSAAQVADRALKPVHARATANARRLGKKKKT